MSSASFNEDTDQTCSYVHGALERPSEYIRLIRLCQPSESDDRIALSLQTHDLASCPEYYALSYAWGSDEATEQVLVDGARFNIRPNLLRFLKKWRLLVDGACNGEIKAAHLDPSKVQYLWIDKVSINQGNNEEKSLQVRRMGDIFLNATKVICWLDHDFGEFPIEEWESSITLPMSRAIRENSYWRRLWIVQELVLAKEVVVLCGHIMVEWCDVQQITAPDYEESLTSDYVGGLDGIWTITSIDGHRRQIRSLKPHPTIQHPLANFSYLECSGPHDKVYGLLGITYRGVLLDVDYSKSICALWWETVELILQSWLADHGSQDLRSLKAWLTDRCQKKIIRIRASDAIESIVQVHMAITLLYPRLESHFEEQLLPWKRSSDSDEYTADYTFVWEILEEEISRRIEVCHALGLKSTIQNSWEPCPELAWRSRISGRAAPQRTLAQFQAIKPGILRSAG